MPDGSSPELDKSIALEERVKALEERQQVVYKVLTRAGVLVYDKLRSSILTRSMAPAVAELIETLKKHAP